MKFFHARSPIAALAGLVVLCSCTSTPPAEPKLVVAAAANFTGVLEQLGEAFHKESGIAVVPSLGSTAQLARQIENGAPFDVFAAADTEHIDQLASKKLILADTRAIYARGQLALWVPDAAKGVRELKDLLRPEIQFIAIAQPDLAPYGRAAVEALQASGMWETLQPKIVYATSISAARQYAQTGNADAAFTAQSLVLEDSGTILKIDGKLHGPLDQAAGVVASSMQPELARRFLAFLLGPQGRAILTENGYGLPDLKAR